MDRVGVEATTSAMLANFYLRADMEREIHSVQIPPAPLWNAQGCIVFGDEKSKKIGGMPIMER